jgi:FtsH-binding integral membrane protein
MVPVCYACLCIGVCATVAYSRHAELGAASRWLIASGTCLVVAGIVAWALESLPVRGVNLIVLASGSALAFVAMFLLGCFGRNPRKWFLVLELAEQSEHGENAEAFAGSAR